MALSLPGLYRKTDTKIFYYQPPQIKGRRVKPISLKTKDEKEAVAAYYAQRDESQRDVVAALASFELERYLSAKKADRTHRPMSSRNARACLTIFLDEVGDYFVGAYTVELVTAWRDRLLLEGLKSSTIKTYMAHAAAFFTWLKKEGLITVNVVENVAIPKVRPTKAERYCTKEERDILLAGSLVNPDWAFVIWTGFYTGMRISEIVEARADWFDLAGGVVHVQETPTFVCKNLALRQIPMPDPYREFMRGYGTKAPFMLRPEKAHGKWRIRVETEGWFEKLATKHEMPWFTSHIMRHTYATLHMQAGTPLGVVSKWLGDQQKTVERIYMGYVRSHGHHNATN